MIAENNDLKPLIVGSVTSFTPFTASHTQWLILSTLVTNLNEKYATITRSKNTSVDTIHILVLVLSILLTNTYLVSLSFEIKLDMQDHRVLCVFVPGIKGSVLRCESCKRRSWPPQFLDSNIEMMRRFMTVRSGKIERLMSTSEIECLTAHTQSVCDVLKEVSVLSGLIKRNVYGKFLERLQKDCDEMGLTPNGQYRRATVYNFAYDWTLGVRHAAAELYSYLQSTVSMYSGVALIAHSMGGLVCRYMLEELLYHDYHKQRPSSKYLFERVKLMYAIGVPHYGAVRSLHHLIDSDGGDLTKYCRGVQSLYDMIPFSDLESQVEGFPVVSGSATCESHRTERHRSDIFLKKTDQRVIIDRKYWRPHTRPNTGQQSSLSLTSGQYQSTDTSRYISYLVDNLCSRFPELTPYRDRLCRGAVAHFSLNSSHKPPGCVYICVNGVGVRTPSLIDEKNRLFRGCKSGDGIVCSVADRKKERGWKRLFWTLKAGKSATRSVHDKNDPEDTPQMMKDTVVHVSMLNCINVFRGVREILATDLFGNSATRNWNGKKCLWDMFVENETMCEEVVSSSSTLFYGHEITATNLKSGYCVLNVIFNSDGGSNDGLDITVMSHSGKHYVLKKENYTNIGITPDADWSRVTVIFGGHHAIYNVQRLEAGI